MEKYKISKDLFISVMDIKNELAHFECTNDIIEYRLYQGRLCKESINDFFFTCIDWAYDNNYTIYTSKNKTEVQLNITKHYTDFEEFTAISQQQAVFNAIEYIRKEIK